MSIHKAKPEHEVAYQDLCKLVSKHANHVSALELLAIASNMVGKMLALQDQRTVTPEMAMELIAKNIEYGNHQATEEVSGAPAGSACRTFS